MIFDVIVHTSSERYRPRSSEGVLGDKGELMRGALESLVYALARLDEKTISVRLTIIDDHSNVHVEHGMRNLLKDAPFLTRFIAHTEVPLQDTQKYLYDYALETAQELIYFADDQHLYPPDSFSQLIDSYLFMRRALGGKEIALVPADYAVYSEPSLFVRERIVLGPERHFRVNAFSSTTFLISKSALLAHAQIFFAQASMGVGTQISASDPIQHLWKDGRVTLFSPLSTIALPLPMLGGAPLVDHEKWWSSYAFPKQSSEKKLY